MTAVKHSYIHACIEQQEVDADTASQLKVACGERARRGRN